MPGMVETGRGATVAGIGSVQKFTLIRHSGYAVGGNPAFEDAVEVCEITDREVYLVRATGGVVYPTREAADAAGVAANAAAPVAGRGHFSSLRIAGAEIYVPRTA